MTSDEKPDDGQNKPAPPRMAGPPLLVLMPLGADPSGLFGALPPGSRIISNFGDAPALFQLVDGRWEVLWPIPSGCAGIEGGSASFEMIVDADDSGPEAVRGLMSLVGAGPYSKTVPPPDAD